MAWNKKLIAEGVLAPDLNDEIRDNWAALEAALTKEHLFSTGETPDTNQGHHRQGSARCYSQATAPGTRANGDAFTSADNGSLWVDSDDNKVYILTDYSDPTIGNGWTSIESVTIATLLAAIRTFAEIITFSKSPVFTLGIVGNDSYLQGRNQADDGNINLIKAGTNDLSTLPDSAEMASNAAPTENEGIANKKYVDDEIDDRVGTVGDTSPADYAADSGGDSRESMTYPNGKIVKSGYIARTGTSTTVTFATPFPNGVVSPQVSVKASSLVSSLHTISAFSKTAMTIKTDGAVSDGYYWEATGY